MDHCSRANSSVGTKSCATPLGRSAGYPDPTRPWYVRVLDSTSGFNRKRLQSTGVHPETQASSLPSSKTGYLPSPKPGHTTDGSGQGGSWPGGKGSRRLGSRKNICLLCSQDSWRHMSWPSSGSTNSLIHAGTAVDDRLLCGWPAVDHIRCLSAVYVRFIGRTRIALWSWLLTSVPLFFVPGHALQKKGLQYK